MSYDVRTNDGRAAGTLSVSRAGLKTVFDYSSELDPGPSRLVLSGEAGLLNVGVPLPAAGGLRLRRSFTRLGLGGFDPDLPFRALLIPADTDISALPPPEPAPAPEPDAPHAPEPIPAPDPAPEPSPAPDTEPAPEPAPSPEPEPSPDTPPSSEPLPEPTHGPTPEPHPDTQSPAGAAPEENAAPRSTCWLPDPDPASRFADPILRASASQIAGALYKTDGEDTLLAFPWSPSMPFPMLRAFRLGTAQEIAGGQYMVFRLKNGQPL